MTARFSKLNKNGQPQTANIVVGILSIYFTVFAPDEWVNYIYAIYAWRQAASTCWWRCPS